MIHTILEQCQAGCATIINDVNGCNEDLTCICTLANGNLLRTCVDCVVAGNYTVAHQVAGQAELDMFYNACTRGGHSVPHLSVSVSIAVSTTAPGTSQIPPATVTGGVGGGDGANVGTTTAGDAASTTKPFGLTGVAVRDAGTTIRGLVMIVAVGVVFLS